jgi:hypothetical protein
MLLFGLGIWLVFGLGFQTVTGFGFGFDKVFSSMLSVIFFGTTLGLLIGWLPNGGGACIKHVCLRLLLWYARCIPFNYPRFLDYAAERILLRKVGGGYIFVHRLLLDYFAAEDSPVFTKSTAKLSGVSKRADHFQ